MKNTLLAAALTAALLTPPLLVKAAPTTTMRAQTAPAYFSAYASLKMERDERGKLEGASAVDLVKTLHKAP